VFSQSFFLLSNLTAENTQDHSVLTEQKNLRVCKLFSWEEKLVAPLIATPNVDKAIEDK
jgi:hypothetical protein